jgi:hypothetical protein
MDGYLKSLRNDSDQILNQLFLFRCFLKEQEQKWKKEGSIIVLFLLEQLQSRRIMRLAMTFLLYVLVNMGRERRPPIYRTKDLNFLFSPLLIMTYFVYSHGNPRDDNFGSFQEVSKDNR